MNVEAAIRRAIPVLDERGSIDPGVLLPWLIRSGIPKAQARAVMRFVPLAFGREVLGEMVALPATYVRITKETGERREVALQDEPFFREARRLAFVIGAEIGGYVIGRIAMQSAEFQAVNAALQAGASPQDLVFASPVVMVDAEENRAPRPWWKFWS